MKRRGFTFAEATAILAVTATTAIMLYPSVAQNATDKRGQCQGNLRQIALGVLQYNQDYDEKYPLIGRPPISSNWAGGWALNLHPYLRNAKLYQCPSEKRAASTNPKQPGYTDYWFNRNLASAWMGQIKSPYQIIMMGDGDGGSVESNACYSLNSLPTTWRQKVGSPSRRHLDGANYAFADGHYKWVKPQQVKAGVLSDSAKENTMPSYTFMVH